jgi:hypothetical protein
MTTLNLDAHSHLLDHCGDETDTIQRQIAEGEVPRCVEIGMKAHVLDDSHAPELHNQVHGQKQSKEDGLQFFILGDCHDVEF